MKNILLFGYSEYGRNIANNFKLTEADITIYVIDMIEHDNAVNDGYKVEFIELKDEWGALLSPESIHETICFCALKDDAQNVFLTISLRAAFEELYIIALGSSKYSADKLRLAGANKAMAKLETTANVIIEALEEPAVLEVMNEVLAHNKELRMAEVPIGEGSVLNGVSLHDVQIHKTHNIIILAVADRETEATFSFTAEGHNHRLHVDDVLVIVGKEHDIENFKREIA